jgi:uncharacterized membrane protein
MPTKKIKLEKKQKRQLVRLERLMDVVYALVIWRLFMLLPRPAIESTEYKSVAAMLGANWELFIVILLATLITIVFWLQNNELFGYLEATDSVHTGLAIFQLLFLLFFLYAIASGLRFEATPDARVVESIAAMLLGIISYASWYYAFRKGNLISSEINKKKAEAILQRNLAEPITAAITIPAAFIGPVFWEVSWFIYPLLRDWLRRSGH